MEDGGGQEPGNKHDGDDHSVCIKTISSHLRHGMVVGGGCFAEMNTTSRVGDSTRLFLSNQPREVVAIMLFGFLLHAAALQHAGRLTTPNGAHTPALTRAAVLRGATAVAAAAAMSTTGSASAIPPPEMLAQAPSATGALKQQAVAPQLQYTPPGVKGLSTPEQIALAEHLKNKGAKFYGAYWCSFCYRQRMMFGAGGTRALPYVECAPDGYQSASATCRSKKEIEGYPTWEIDGKFYSGMRTLQDLQKISGFDPKVRFPEYVPPPPPPRPPPPPGGFRSPEVTTASKPEDIALAKHLKSTGAKFYGAYWCGYCNRQRTLFGAEATAALPYVECASDGYKSAASACKAKDVDGYPTWEIGGKFYGGYKPLEELARLSGFSYAAAAKSKAPPTVVSVDTSGGGVLRGEDCKLSEGEEDCK